MIMNYPKEWDELPKHERKKKIRELKRRQQRKQESLRKVRNIIIVAILILGGILGYRTLNQKTPEEIVFEKEVEEISLDGKIEEFEIEGENHISPGETVSNKTNPPTSGSHWATPADWKFFDKELTDEQVVHNLEHGGIWITYKDLDESSIGRLKEVARNNSDSVVASKRDKNEDKIVVASWGRMMRLTKVDEALIQKYIDTYINQSPEKLAR